MTTDTLIAEAQTTQLPPIPDDLARLGWRWSVATDGDICLDNPTDGYCTPTTGMTEPDVVIAEARAIVAREAAALAELGEETPRPAPAQPAREYTPELIPLAQLNDNPYQPRIAYEQEAIAELAQAIRAEGLLQPPSGRRMPDGRVQLAFGHRRLRAFDLLAAESPARYSLMPVIIRTLDDESMARQAWKENRDRRDLTAYEEARAIARYLSEFGWSQGRVATELGLDKSTVSNKLRLLKLPPAALAMLERGELSERQAIAILPLAELPEAAWAAYRSPQLVYLGGAWRSTLAEFLAGAAESSADATRQAVKDVIAKLTIDLANEPWAKEAWSLPQQRCTTCTDCALKMSGDRCPDKACAAAKRGAWLMRQAAPAAASVGLPAVAVTDGYGTYDPLGGVAIMPLRAEAQRRGCGTLGVAALTRPTWSDKPVKGHDGYGIVCAHGRDGRCLCKVAVLRSQDTKKAEVATKKADKQVARVRYKEPAEQALAASLAQAPIGVLRVLSQRLLGHSARERLGATPAAAPLAAALAVDMVHEAIKYPYEYSFAGADPVRQELEKLLATAQIALPWAETAPPAPPPAELVARIRQRCDEAIDLAEMPIAEAYLADAREALATIAAADPLRVTLAAEIAGAAILVADGQRRGADARAAEATADAATEARAGKICPQNPHILDALTNDLAQIEARLRAGCADTALLVSYANDLDVIEDRLTAFSGDLDDAPYEALTGRIGEAQATIAARIEGDAP